MQLKNVHLFSIIKVVFLHDKLQSDGESSNLDKKSEILDLSSHDIDT